MKPKNQFVEILITILGTIAIGWAVISIFIHAISGWAFHKIKQDESSKQRQNY